MKVAERKALVKKIKSMNVEQVRIILFSRDDGIKKIVYIAELYTQPREGYYDNFLKSGDFSAHIRNDLVEVECDEVEIEVVEEPNY